MSILSLAAIHNRFLQQATPVQPSETPPHRLLPPDPRCTRAFTTISGAAFLVYDLRKLLHLPTLAVYKSQEDTRLLL